MDHFTHNIIRNEMRALTASPAPSPASWAFSPENDLIFAVDRKGEKVTPQEWMTRGLPRIHVALAHSQ
jgi:ion channel-forming bestrophin family protein